MELLIRVRIPTLQPSSMKKRTSPIWDIPKIELEEVVKISNSLSIILSNCGLSNNGGGRYKVLQKRLIEDNIDYSHIKLGLDSNSGRKFVSTDKIDFSEILIENSTYDRAGLKRRLLCDGLLINKCYICNQLPEWNGKPLTLQIDHINGINNDNRIENLRILCPHCHTQTSTFAGRNLKRRRSPRPSKLNPNWRNNPKLSVRKVERPSKEELEKLLWKMPTTKIAEQFGVSDKAIGKWAKSYGIAKPPRGYWQKKNAA